MCLSLTLLHIRYRQCDEFHLLLAICGFRGLSCYLVESPASSRGFGDFEGVRDTGFSNSKL